MIRRKERWLAFILSLVFFITGSYESVFAADNKTLSYDYYFEASDPSNLSYDLDEEIEVEGKHYRLIDTTYDIHQEPIKKEVSYKSKEKKADEYLTETVQGVVLKLYPQENIKWNDNQVTYSEEFASEGDVPEQVEHDGKKLRVRSVDASSRTDNVSTSAYFYTKDLNNNEYIFNGKSVYLTGGDPKWDGWRSDYARYLGIQNSNVYTITGTAWQGGAYRRADGTYVRRAAIYGTKVVNYVIATYGLADESERYTAKVIYTSNYVAHVKATYEKYITTKEKIIYAAAGIGVLAIMTALILLILAKRRKEDEE